MKQSHLITYQDLLKQSLLVPALVTKSARKDSDFLPSLNDWLIETEQLMEKNNIARCSEIAGLRSKIVAVNYSIEPKVSKKKRQLSIASSIVYEAQKNLLDVLEPIGASIDEAREAVKQLLSVAYQANMINVNLEFSQLIQQLWSSFLQHEQLKGITIRILVLVNQSDALRLLAEEIDMSLLVSSTSSSEYIQSD